MSPLDALQALPVWLAGALVCAACAGLAVLLQVTVRRLAPPGLLTAHNDIVGFLIAVAGAVYAVLLAFVAVDAWNDLEQADKLVRREAALVGDLLQEAAVLPEPARQEVRGLLVGYVQAVIAEEWPAMAAGRLPQAGRRELTRLAAMLRTLLGESAAGGSGVHGMPDHLNRLHEARRERILASRQALQPVVWAVLLLGGVTMIAFSALFGPPHAGFHGLLCALLGFSIALALLLIVVADRPFRGIPRIEPDPFRFAIGLAADEP